jgi:hypothetical protein
MKNLATSYWQSAISRRVYPQRNTEILPPRGVYLSGAEGLGVRMTGERLGMVTSINVFQYPAEESVVASRVR